MQNPKIKVSSRGIIAVRDSPGRTYEVLPETSTIDAVHVEEPWTVVYVPEHIGTGFRKGMHLSDFEVLKWTELTANEN